MIGQLKRLFGPSKPKPEPVLTREQESRLTEMGKQAWIAKSVLCIIYAYIGDVRTEIFRRNINTRSRFFSYKDGNYLLMTTKDKVTIDKAPWYSLGVQYKATLKFEEGNPIPLSHSKSDVIADAYGLNRVMDKASRDSLLPSSDSMLMFICAILVILTLMSVGLAMYTITVPGGAENIRTFTTPQARLNQEGN